MPHPIFNPSNALRIWRTTDVFLHRRIRLCLIILLVLQTGLLSWAAFANSPVVDEIAHLPAGLSQWRFQKFDLYRVNPPLVRAIAAVPVLFSGCKEDWTVYQSIPLVREEFEVGRAFVSANGENFFFCVSLARLACIPFSLLGTLVCYQWAREISDRRGGLFAAVLFVVSPNMLAHGGLITPDAAGAAFGVLAAYAFWRWLKSPTLSKMLMSGIALGLAELTKSTWIILFGIWPLIFIVTVTSRSNTTLSVRHSRQLAVLLLTGLYILNAGYLFEDSLKPLGSYQFLSSALSGSPRSSSPDPRIRSRVVQPGNRFRDTVLSAIPVPLPGNYLRGIDLQKVDFEVAQPSYLRGEWQDHGCWYYYLYALAVKVPLGSLLLTGISAVAGIVLLKKKGIPGREMLVLFLPPLSVLLLVSLQTGINKHLRYVLPLLPFAFVAVGASVGRLRGKSLRCLRSFCYVLLLWTSVSSLRLCPFSLTYFNELAGGPENGARHLLDSNLDWGQSLIALKRWNHKRDDLEPLFVSYSGMFDPADVGIDCRPVPIASDDPPAGWYAISLNRLYGPEQIPGYFRTRSPDRVLDYSMAIFHVE